MLQLHFTKMHGLGNDFVVLDDLAHPLPSDFDFSTAAERLCARPWGVGSDGLMLLTHPDKAARAAGAKVRMRMWNPDGTEDMCGNGLRCIVHLAHRRGYGGGDQFTVQTPVGLRAAQVLPDGQVRVAMGEPVFEPEKIPLKLPPHHAGPIEYTLPVGDALLEHVTSLNTGSTHTVIFVPEELSEESYQKLSPQIEIHPWFPERTSVMWTQVVSDSRLKLRIWERGVGETIACGTGASAAAVAAQVTGRCHGSIEVESRGGVLRIEWEPGQEIFKTGPAAVVYVGTETYEDR